MTPSHHRDLFGTTSNGCPWWCDQEPGHGYDLVDEDGQPARIHSREVGTVHGPDHGTIPVYVEAMETLVLDTTGTRLSLGPASCSAPQVETLSEPMAQKLAGLLQEAAALLSAIDST